MEIYSSRVLTEVSCILPVEEVFEGGSLVLIYCVILNLFRSHWFLFKDSRTHICSILSCFFRTIHTLIREIIILIKWIQIAWWFFHILVFKCHWIILRLLSFDLLHLLKSFQWLGSPDHVRLRSTLSILTILLFFLDVDLHLHLSILLIKVWLRVIDFDWWVNGLVINSLPINALTKGMFFNLSHSSDWTNALCWIFD